MFFWLQYDMHARERSNMCGGQVFHIGMILGIELGSFDCSIILVFRLFVLLVFIA